MKRPLSVTIIGWLFVATGAIAAAFYLSGYRPARPFDYDIVWPVLVNLIAIVAGYYMLRGRDWARWLALAWMGFHVAISVGHPMQELAIHSALFVLLAVFLFRRPAAEYFRGTAPARPS
jgi:hypothetical protein